MRLSVACNILAITALGSTTIVAFVPQHRMQNSIIRHTTQPTHAKQPTFLRMSDMTTTEEIEQATYELLSLPARPGRPLKVSIAGGGVGGLTAALYMLKSGFDVTVYEKTAAFARFGGPIQFASNALSVLNKIDNDLFNQIMDKFTFTGTRACGIKDGLRADGSFRMTGDSLDYLINPDAPADWFVKFPLAQCADLFGLPYTGVIDRPDLQEILIDECKKIKPDFLKNGNPVTSYINNGKGRGVTAVFADGTTVDSDILVGSDGIWSAVRAVMYGEEIKKSTDDKLKRQGCTYSGYTVFAGETVLDTPDYYETGYKVYIGPQRYFVTSDVGGGRIQWYAFFALPPGTKRAPSGWGGSAREDQADPEENLVEYIKSLHQGWSDEVMTVLNSTPPESVEQRDLYDRAPEFLRSWADGNVVLMGDAVHPMMPNLGQGGCQAIEDAYVLTEVLKEATSTEQLEDALQQFYRKRILRVSTVQFLSRLASDLIINAFDTPWSPHDNLGKSWKSYLTFAWKPVLQYMIFPLQFAYLYSYHPTGDMKDLPKALEAKWKEFHKKESQAAFEKVAKEGIGSFKTGPSFFQKAKVEETNVPKSVPKQVIQALDTAVSELSKPEVKNTAPFFAVKQVASFQEPATKQATDSAQEVKKAIAEKVEQLAQEVKAVEEKLSAVEAKKPLEDIKLPEKKDDVSVQEPQNAAEQAKSSEKNVLAVKEKTENSEEDAAKAVETSVAVAKKAKEAVNAVEKKSVDSDEKAAEINKDAVETKVDPVKAAEKKVEEPAEKASDVVSKMKAAAPKATETAKSLEKKVEPVKAAEKKIEESVKKASDVVPEVKADASKATDTAKPKVQNVETVKSAEKKIEVPAKKGSDVVSEGKATASNASDTAKPKKEQNVEPVKAAEKKVEVQAKRASDVAPQVKATAPESTKTVEKKAEPVIEAEKKVVAEVKKASDVKNEVAQEVKAATAKASEAVKPAGKKVEKAADKIVEQVEAIVAEAKAAAKSVEKKIQDEAATQQAAGSVEEVAQKVEAKKNGHQAKTDGVENAAKKKSNEVSLDDIEIEIEITTEEVNNKPSSINIGGPTLEEQFDQRKGAGFDQRK